MKKKLIFATTAVALVLSLTLFAVSVFAAVSQTFGVSNKITFVGASEYMAFDMNAVITGTTLDGDPDLTHTWNYDYSKDDPTSSSWNIGKTLVFNREGVAEGQEFILYTFTIQNRSEGKDILAYIEVPEIDTKALSYELKGSEHNPVQIAEGQTDTITLTLRPVTAFEGKRDCNFIIHISPKN